MPSTYSPNLRVELIANGEQSGTWGNTTNVNLGTILDSAIAGYTQVTVGSATNLALTANNGASDQSRNMIVQLSSATGTGTDFNLFIPPASKFYVIRNDTTKNVTIGNSTALNGTTASGGTTVTIKTGVTSLIFSDGTNVREALTGFAGSLDINGNLVVNGDTTLGNARISGTYTYVSASVIQVNTGVPHGYTAGQSVGFIVTSVTAGNAKSGYYAISGTPSSTQFNLTYTPGGLNAASAGNCLVTNETITLNGIVQPGVIIEGSSSTLPALRITAQSGTAAAFVVDDESNPDSTPFLIDASGSVVTGNTAALTTFNNTTITPRIQEIGTTVSDAVLGIALFNATDANSPTIDLAKAGAAAVGTYTAVVAGEALGLIRFSGSDGTDFAPAATIGGFADAEFTTSGDTTDSPGRLVFSTVPDGSNTLTERMRINNAGNVIIGIGEGTASATGGILRAPDEVGTNLVGADFTVAAGNGTGTGGSGSILFQTAPVSTTGSTANALATVMAISNTGNVGIGSTSLTNTSLRASKNITGSATSYGIFQDGQIQSTVTSAIYNFTAANIATGTALTTLTHYEASQGTYTGTAATQYAFRADTDLIGATTNYGFAQTGVTSSGITAGKVLYNFYSAQNAAPSGGGVAYGFFATGTAVNSFSNLSSDSLSASALLARGTTETRGEVNAYAPINVTSTAYLNALAPQTVAQATAVNVNNTITLASPVFVNDTVVMLESSGTLPTSTPQLDANTLYYVISTSATSYYAGTGSITGSTLTMSSMQSGSLGVGATVTGVGVPSGVTVVSGTGPTYTITPSLATPVTSTTISGTYAGSQTIKLATTFGGTEINITAVGTGNLTLTPVSLANTPPIGSSTKALATTEFVANSVVSYQTKTAVKAATTQNITLSGAQTIDGISIVAGDRVLVKDQFASSQTATITLSSTATATFTTATPTVVTVAAAPASGTPVTFSTTGVLPTGITAGQIYYISNVSGTTFNISESQTLSPLVAVTAAGSGTHTATYLGVISVGSSLTAGTQVEFTTTGALPTGLTAGQTYYTLRTGTTFSVAFMPGGTPITFSGSQSGTQTIGVTPAATNGIYLANASTWTRAADMDSAAETAASSVPVLSGTANGGKIFNTSFKSTNTLGTTTMRWDEVITGSAGDNTSTLGGVRITVSGTTLNIFTY